MDRNTVLSKVTGINIEEVEAILGNSDDIRPKNAKVRLRSYPKPKDLREKKLKRKRYKKARRRNRK